jgi:hypothetical protein
MSPDELIEISVNRLHDLAERCAALQREGKKEDAQLLIQEGALMVRALDENDVFLVFQPPEILDA